MPVIRVATSIGKKDTHVESFSRYCNIRVMILAGEVPLFFYRITLPSWLVESVGIMSICKCTCLEPHDEQWFDRTGGSPAQNKRTWLGSRYSYDVYTVSLWVCSLYSSLSLPYYQDSPLVITNHHHHHHHHPSQDFPNPFLTSLMFFQVGTVDIAPTFPGSSCATNRPWCPWLQIIPSPTNFIIIFHQLGRPSNATIWGNHQLTAKTSYDVKFSWDKPMSLKISIKGIIFMQQTKMIKPT